ncbi:MAG TPA: type II secretion system ATPase GspE [Gammaproteobacteria bacterium]|nr:type II secretion system ATPase GspE [Gammaproteobacteria bacterium]
MRELADDHALIAHRRDADPLALLELRRLFSRPLRLEAIDREEFDRLLQQSYEEHQTIEGFETLEARTDLSSVADQLPEPEDLLEADDDAPIIRLINALLSEAVRENASDIHIEPFEDYLVVRMRVDGVLREVLKSRRAVAPLVVSRVKVMARLDIAEKRLPQDGRISLRLAGRPVDVRVSTIPCGHGERVVMRLLDKQAGTISLQHLGMPAPTREVLEDLIRKPHGILLVTGPTGSGKSTTLYAALMRLNDHSRNIMTVEDPIEYYIDGIGQTQVNTRVQMTFARGLRAILRQDPDVVMVGEIRDLETAEIAIQASLTGHLVLSTLHTNTAVGAIPRLDDMGVESFLLSSSLIGLLAQRLVRLLCADCREPYRPEERERKLIGFADKGPLTFYRAVGCEACNRTGYRGRTGIYELVPVDDKMRRLIHDRTGEQDLEAYARTRSAGIRAHGRERVLAGETSVEEVLRVTRED